MKELQKQIIQALAERLAPYGFVKRSGNCFTRDISKNVWQRIEFPPSYYHPGVKAIYPGIAVGYKDEFDLQRKFFNFHFPYPRYSYSTFYTMLLNLVRTDDLCWTFRKEEDIIPQIDDMTQTVVKKAIPYMDYISDRKNLIAEMESGFIYSKFETWCHTRLPIAYYLEGRNDLALWRLNYYIQKFETELSGYMKEDENSHSTNGARNKLQDYMEFARKLKKVMEAESR